MITNAIDSTTKKEVRTFACQGIHIGQNVPFPIGLLDICGETTEDIALQTDFTFGMLSAVHSKGKEELYQMINTHDRFSRSQQGICKNSCESIQS